MPLGKINTKDPTLQKIMDATNREVIDLENLPFYLGNPTNVLISKYNASIEDLVLCNPTTAGFSVVLPDINNGDIGKIITVVNVSNSTNSITVKPQDGDTINGNTGWIR
jgi:hypothetical protein